MRRVLCHIGGRPIDSYAAMLYCGIVLGIYAAMFAARSDGVSPGRVLAAILLLLPIALMGARLLYVAPRWREYAATPGRVFRFSEGGAAMYGGLLLAPPASLGVLPWLGLEVGAFWDFATLTMLIGMIVTRAGCLMSGCCSGRPTESWYGLRLSNSQGVSARRVPTQLLEAGWGALVLACVVALWPERPLGGAIFLFTIGAYGAGRIALEPLRDRPDIVGAWSLQGAISVGLVVISVVGVAAAWWR